MIPLCIRDDNGLLFSGFFVWLGPSRAIETIGEDINGVLVVLEKLLGILDASLELLETVLKLREGFHGLTHRHWRFRITVRKEILEPAQQIGEILVILKIGQAINCGHEVALAQSSGTLMNRWIEYRVKFGRSCRFVPAGFDIVDRHP